MILSPVLKSRLGKDLFIQAYTPPAPVASGKVDQNRSLIFFGQSDGLIVGLEPLPPIHTCRCVVFLNA